MNLKKHLKNYNFLAFAFFGILNGITFHISNEFRYSIVFILLSFTVLFTKYGKLNPFKVIIYLFLIIASLLLSIDPDSKYLLLEKSKRDIWHLFAIHIFFVIWLLNGIIFSSFHISKKSQILRYIEVFGNITVIYISFALFVYFSIPYIYTKLDVVTINSANINFGLIRDITAIFFLFLAYYFSVNFFKVLKRKIFFLLQGLIFFSVIYLSVFLIIFFLDMEFLFVEHSVLKYLDLHTFISFGVLILALSKKTNKIDCFDNLFIILILQISLFSLLSIIGNIKWLYLLNLELNRLVSVMINLIILSNMFELIIIYLRFKKSKILIKEIQNFQGKYIYIFFLYFVVVSIFIGVYILI